MRGGGGGGGRRNEKKSASAISTSKFQYLMYIIRSFLDYIQSSCIIETHIKFARVLNVS